MHNKSRLGLGAKLVLVVIVVLIGIFIVNQPTQAADTAGRVGTELSDAGNGLGTFLGNLFD